jgi:hypothetical protein
MDFVPLEHDAPRYTPEQRDAILNLATRLQMEHETTVGADDLVRAAEEAGIDARFVHDAAMRLGRKPQGSVTLRGPLIAFILTILQAGLFAMDLLHSHRFPEPLDLLASGAVMFPLAFWGAQYPTVRRFVPVTAIVVWIALMVPLSFLNNQFLFVLPHVATQFAVACFATLLATAFDKRRKVQGVGTRASDAYGTFQEI